MTLPTDPQARKGIPLYSGLIRYFPNALMAVAELSRVGNDQHNPGEPLHWAREKSGDELDAATRHLFEAGTMDTDNVLHSTKLAWRALANLEKELEGYEAQDKIEQPKKRVPWCDPQQRDLVLIRIGHMDYVVERVIDYGKYTYYFHDGQKRVNNDPITEPFVIRGKFHPFTDLGICDA